MIRNLNIQYIHPRKLIPSARNARTHSSEQISQVAACIKKFGFINPIIVDENNIVVAGHARLLAAGKLHLDRVPYIAVNHLSDPELRAYMLADNKIAENSGWDEGLLRVELEYLTSIDIDFDVDMTGFSIAETDILLGVVEQAGCENIAEESVTPSSEAISRPGDIWQLGEHRLACGDCRDEELLHQLLDGKQAAMVFTDPPYNVKIQGHVSGLGKAQHGEFAMASGEMSESEFREFLFQCFMTLSMFASPGSLHYICMDWRHLQTLLEVGEAVFDQLMNMCVWAKTNGGMGSLYRSQHEFISIFKKGKEPHVNNVQLGKNGRYRTNLWTYPGVNTFSKDREEALSVHPTVKPTQLVADAILDVTKPGQIVLDGFIGSGTTILAAEKINRRCYGIEIDPAYVDVAVHRWIEHSGGEAVNLMTGKSFDEMNSDGQIQERNND